MDAQLLSRSNDRHAWSADIHTSTDHLTAKATQYSIHVYIPVFGVLEFAYDLGELGVCSGGVDYLGYVALPT